MRAIAAGLTDIGRERNHNEDRFILLPEFNVFVVADGMGGHQSGEVASRMAAATIATYFRGHNPPGHRNGSPDGNVADTLKAAVCDANAKIFARADDSRAHRGMGTTVVAAAYRSTDGSMHVVHAGDSRAYHIRGDSMKQLTRDHSLLSDALLERPELTEADLAYLPRNVITRALGIAPTVEVDASSCEAQSGDVFLLCSDGLHGLVDDAAIRTIVSETEVLTEACSRLIEAANRNGGKDNITAVLIRIEDDDEPWSVRSPGAVMSGPGRVSQPPSVDPAAPTDPAPLVQRRVEAFTRSEARDETPAAPAAETPAPSEVSEQTETPAPPVAEASTPGEASDQAETPAMPPVVEGARPEPAARPQGKKKKKGPR
jgi:serine/threonine protein phosphatase PrpC